MSLDTIGIEDQFLAPFADKIPLSVERGEGVYVWGEDGKRYLDFTSGWGVTCLGHASPIITEALLEQSRKIIQNPNSGATYSPARARLLELMHAILPSGLSRIFFTNSGAEANDAALKLARKASGKRMVISTERSFHGRTISTVSATGQRAHLERFQPLMPDYRFVPFGDNAAMAAAIHDDVAAVILEPIQGEGGVNIPLPEYLPFVAELCARNGAYLIVDEIQTGFFRTGPLFASSEVRVDIMTMAKGIAGGFPFGAFAMTEEIAARLEKGDHGGTYCGNPLGCAVSLAVIQHMLAADIGGHVELLGNATLDTLRAWQKTYPAHIRDVRGRGLLIALELASAELTDRINALCLVNGLILNVKHGRIIRIFPALNITRAEIDEGLAILHDALQKGIESLP